MCKQNTMEYSSVVTGNKKNKDVLIHDTTCLPRAGGRGMGLGNDCIWACDFFNNDGNVLKLDCSDGCICKRKTFIHSIISIN